MDKKPLILVTNDDGINALGIRTLIDEMLKIGEVVVVASHDSQSGMGHAITMKVPLVFKQVVDLPGHSEFLTNGTPADNIKIGLHKILDRKPDLVVSGINHGSNSSINIIYSGTMAAVLEAAMGDIPAIGFSLQDFSHDADFSFTRRHITNICNDILENGMPENTALNVNFPKANGSEYNGVKVCRQAKSYWKEDFSERIDPRTGKPYYWLTGEFHILDQGEDTDEHALKNNYVSLVPVKFDFTQHSKIELFKSRFPI